MDNGDGQKQKMVSMAEFLCGKCQGKVVARIPVMDVINRLTYSQVIFTHERPVQCGKCSSLYMPVISGLSEKMEIKLTWKRIPTKEEIEKNSTLTTPKKETKVEDMMAQINTERKM